MGTPPPSCPLYRAAAHSTTCSAYTTASHNRCLTFKRGQQMPQTRRWGGRYLHVLAPAATWSHTRFVHRRLCARPPASALAYLARRRLPPCQLAVLCRGYLPRVLHCAIGRRQHGLEAAAELRVCALTLAGWWEGGREGMGQGRRGQMLLTHSAAAVAVIASVPAAAVTDATAAAAAAAAAAAVQAATPPRLRPSLKTPGTRRSVVRAWLPGVPPKEPDTPLYPEYPEYTAGRTPAWCCAQGALSQRHRRQRHPRSASMGCNPEPSQRLSRILTALPLCPTANAVPSG
eukprot:366474-Chlamydomonas_euryale.AAC.11